MTSEEQFRLNSTTKAEDIFQLAFSMIPGS